MQAFRMYGRIIEVNRYAVSYEEQLPPLPDQDTEEPETIHRVEYLPTKEEADAIAQRTGGTVSPLEAGEWEWLDGIEVDDVPDTFSEAVKIQEMGQAAYVQTKEKTQRALHLQDITELVFTQMAQTRQISDNVVVQYPEMFARWTESWLGKAGDIVRDEGNLYRCIHDVTNPGQNTKPSQTPAMWTRIADPAEEWPQWIQPIGAHDAYDKGEKVKHKNKHWMSEVDGNVWEPGVYGWTEQIVMEE